MLKAELEKLPRQEAKKPRELAHIFPSMMGDLQVPRLSPICKSIGSLKTRLAVLVSYPDPLIPSFFDSYLQGSILPCVTPRFLPRQSPPNVEAE